MENGCGCPAVIIALLFLFTAINAFGKGAYKPGIGFVLGAIIVFTLGYWMEEGFPKIRKKK